MQKSNISSRHFMPMSAKCTLYANGHVTTNSQSASLRGKNNMAAGRRI